VRPQGQTKAIYTEKCPALLPGKVIASQTNGFWIKLIENHRTKIDWAKIFHKGLKGHFSVHKSYWKTAQIDDLLKRLNEVNELRNRIAHHEPLWKFTKVLHPKTQVMIYPQAKNPTESIQRMLTLNDRICRLLGWISDDRRVDYLNSYYKKHFDWFCKESTIEIYKNYAYVEEMPFSKVKREMRKILKVKSLVEIKHKHGGMIISRGF
ncbi:CAAX protease, partial [Acinetobacter baumannii]|nr:CAAX protease [Acinetobacter baumannii]